MANPSGLPYTDLCDIWSNVISGYFSRIDFSLHGEYLQHNLASNRVGLLKLLLVRDEVKNLSREGVGGGGRGILIFPKVLQDPFPPLSCTDIR